jgi:hypothetical protein
LVGAVGGAAVGGTAHVKLSGMRQQRLTAVARR